MYRIRIYGDYLYPWNFSRKVRLLNYARYWVETGVQYLTLKELLNTQYKDLDAKEVLQTFRTDVKEELKRWKKKLIVIPEVQLGPNKLDSTVMAPPAVAVQPSPEAPMRPVPLTQTDLIARYTAPVRSQRYYRSHEARLNAEEDEAFEPWGETNGEGATAATEAPSGRSSNESSANGTDSATSVGSKRSNPSA